MKKAYRSVNFRADSLAKIEQMQAIVDEYQKQNLRMTARQLYYQLVSRDLIPNQPAEYKKVTALLTDARYAGMIDWDAIEDRGREPSTPSEWDSLSSLVESALRAYRRPRWVGQKHYVELWVEKQALAGVLAPLASEFHATLMVNKGYSSASAMKESADRIKAATITDVDRLDEISEQLEEAARDFGADSDELTNLREEITPEVERLLGPKPIVLYLGDHDPSGEDMVRDIETRLKEFGVLRLTVEKVALTTAQVRRYNPPPNPAKLTDPRAKGYIAEHGAQSWEVDALPPNVLTQLIRQAFRRFIDAPKMAAVKELEAQDKQRLREAVKELES